MYKMCLKCPRYFVGANFVSPMIKKKRKTHDSSPVVRLFVRCTSFKVHHLIVSTFEYFGWLDDINIYLYVY